MPLTIKTDHFYWSATWSMTLLTAVAIVAFIRLGVWQWHRAQFKTAQQAQFAVGAQSVMPLVAANADVLPRYTTVRVSGRYDGEHQFLLENMSLHGRAGFEVLTPLLLTDGAVLLVNRGWVPAMGPPTKLPDVSVSSAAASGTTTVIGRLDNLPVVGIALGHIPPAADDHWPKVTAFPTMTDLAAALHRPLASRQLLLDPGDAEGYAREWQPAGFGAGRHLSYAVQWWCFAALSLLLYGLLNRHRRAPA